MSSAELAHHFASHYLYRIIYIIVSILVLLLVTKKVKGIVHVARTARTHLRLVLYPQIILTFFSVAGGIVLLFIHDKHFITKSLWVLSFNLPSIIMIFLIDFFKNSIEKCKTAFMFMLFFMAFAVAFMMISLLTWLHKFLIVSNT